MEQTVLMEQTGLMVPTERMVLTELMAPMERMGLTELMERMDKMDKMVTMQIWSTFLLWKKESPVLNLIWSMQQLVN